ncbi:hypothetical protein DUZ99_12060 [Xylanibacillus composti]|uniref:Uncharacterized protein n=1 Tax=Xylanibacillus composti TaxID=1572762 RepID=A0A8J4H8T6_9BACL|nr:hypothetical protein [Xylanibacillus composti]MDT9725708.1 hypothetical protein [Xylanibacillus composti]GIQ71153.1 hypothetical protein XYCOK13_39770 [Xylanibacillus composti]
MHLLCSYPVQADTVLPHCNKPIVAMTTAGDLVPGIIDGVRDGVLYLRPVGKEAGIAMIQRVKKYNKNKISVPKKAKTKAFGFGYPSYGYGAGLALALPLFLLAALFAFPPFFI